MRIMIFHFFCHPKGNGSGVLFSQDAANFFDFRHISSGGIFQNHRNLVVYTIEISRGVVQIMEGACTVIICYSQ